MTRSNTEAWRAAGEPDPHEDRYDCPRSETVMGHMSDDELANAQYVVSRDSVDLIQYQTAAKDRIRWLSRRVAALEQRRDQLTMLREANIARQLELRNLNPGAEWFSLSFRSNELQSEAGELGNQVKKIERVRMGYPGSQPQPGKIEDEVADVVISLDLLAMDLDVDPWPEIVRKFNADSAERGLATRLPEPEERA